MAYLESLNEDRIFRLEKKSFKESALETMAREAARVVPGFSVEELYKKLLEREESASTGMGNGLAIPHTRLNGLDEAQILLFISSDGVYFNSIDGKPVKVFFLVLSPAERSDSHLLILQEIAMKASDIGFADSLAAEKTAYGVQHFLKT